MKFLTVLVAGLPEWFPLGEHNGNNEILEAGDVEEAGVLKVHDVVLVHLCVIVVRFVEVRSSVTNATGRQRKYRVKFFNVTFEAFQKGSLFLGC